MMYRYLFIGLFLTSICINGLESQNTILINNVFEGAFKTPLDFQIELAHKFKVKKIKIQNHELHPFCSYDFYPRKRNVNLHLRLSAIGSDESEYIRALIDKGANIQYDGSITIVKINQGTGEANKIFFALLLKKFALNSETQNFQVEVTGNQAAIEANLASIIKSLDESSVFMSSGTQN